MKMKGLVLICISVLMATLVIAGAYAGTAMPTEGPLTAPYEHTKKVIDFTHQKHVNDHKVACAECHHDDQGKPLTGLKEGDEVKVCFDCHNKPGEVKGREAKGLSDKEQRAYHTNAVHDNCIDCHRKYNREMKKKTAPQTCIACHPK